MEELTIPKYMNEIQVKAERLGGGGEGREWPRVYCPVR